MDIDRDVKNTPPFYALGIIAYSIEKTLEHASIALEHLNKILEDYEDKDKK